MTVETGSSISDLDPNAPVNAQPAGEGNEHIQRTKLALTYTFDGSTGDRYDETSGPVKVGPVALNQLPLDVAAIATEIGLDLANLGTPTRIDDLETNAVRRDQAETISQNWAFTGNVDFSTGAVTFTGIVPTIDGVDVATVNDIPSYLERSRLQIKSVGDGDLALGIYTVDAADIGKKLNYVASTAGTISIAAAGTETDLLFVTNTTANVLTLSTTGLFLKPDGTTGSSMTITGATKTVGLHKVGGNWQVSGDFDL